MNLVAAKVSRVSTIVCNNIKGKAQAHSHQSLVRSIAMAAATATAMMAHQQAPAVRMDDAELRVQLPGSVSGPLAELGPEKPDIMYIHLGDAETRAIEQTLVAFKGMAALAAQCAGEGKPPRRSLLHPIIGHGLTSGV